MDTADDDAILCELLAFLDGADAAQPSADASVPSEAHLGVLCDVGAPVPPPPRPLKRAVRKGGAARLKELLDDLRAEASSLTEQLERLRGSYGADLADAKERAITERRKRQRAEQHCATLRAAVSSQRRYIGGLRSVFSATPRLALELDLCRYLHRPTRLVRDRHTRWGDVDAASHDARMRSAMDLLCHETMSLNLLDGADAPLPLISGETVDSGESMTTTSMAVYAVDSTALGAVVRATCVAVRGIATICATGHALDVVHDIVDVDASSVDRNTLYRVLAIRHPCVHLNEALSIQTHVLTSFKVTADYAIVLWDFVDADELHPTPDATNVAREVTGACLIRREWCGSSGSERTVVRSLTTKKYRFLNDESAAKLRRFACIMHPTALVQGNELLFRRILLEQLATETTIDSQTQEDSQRAA